MQFRTAANMLLWVCSGAISGQQDRTAQRMAPRQAIVLQTWCCRAGALQPESHSFVMLCRVLYGREAGRCCILQMWR